MYMYINFPQNPVSISIKTVHTHLFAQNRKLHKFASSNSNLKKRYYFRHASTYNIGLHVCTCISIFPKIGLVDQSKLCTHIYLSKNCISHKFATTNSTFEKSRLSDMHYLITDIQAELEINRPIRYQITATRNYFKTIDNNGIFLEN